MAVSAIVAGAGDHAARRFLEFFAATIRNKNTRMAYYRAVTDFFAWVERHKIGHLVDIEPLHVAAYVETLQATVARPTVKQHLAAIRMCFENGKQRTPPVSKESSPCFRSVICF
jgi:integrase/recombinase XerD